MIYFKDYFGFTIGISVYLAKKKCFFYLYNPMGLIIISTYIKVKYYLTIENNLIKQNYIFGKKIDLSEIKSIKHFAGEYILRTDTRKMRIN